MRYKYYSRYFLAGIAIVFFCGSPARGKTGIGLIGQSGWSDSFFLANPDGWGISLSKSLSQKVSIRITFSRFDNNFNYLGNLEFGFPPPELVSTTELINADVSAKFYEFSIHHTILSGSKMLLEVGGGFGRSKFDLDLVGKSTNKTVSTFGSPFVLTGLIEFSIKKFIYSPFSLRFGYQYRTMRTREYATDGFQPFLDVRLSGVRVALLARW